MQVDPYVKCSVRDNRISRTQTLSNNNKPVWNETFDLIVDDPDLQSLTLNVMDDDLGAFDDVSPSSVISVISSVDQAILNMGTGQHEFFV